MTGLSMGWTGGPPCSQTNRQTALKHGHWEDSIYFLKVSQGQVTKHRHFIITFHLRLFDLDNPDIRNQLW